MVSKRPANTRTMSEVVLKAPWELLPTLSMAGTPTTLFDTKLKLPVLAVLRTSEETSEMLRSVAAAGSSCWCYCASRTALAGKPN